MNGTHHYSRSLWRKSSYSTNGGDCVECASATWRKSSYSNGNGGNCVECASATWATSSYSGAHGENCVECASATWITSSYSGSNGGECVECAPLPASMAVRDSKHPEAGHLTVLGGEWAAFLNAVKHGELGT